MEITYWPSWKWGIPAPFWIKNIGIIEDVIRKLEIKPVPAAYLADYLALTPILLPNVAFTPIQMPSVATDKERTVLKPRPIPGGIRIPHLHSKGDIYILNEQQWKEFSKEIMGTIKEKLARANAVNFEQVMEISEAMDSLT